MLTLNMNLDDAILVRRLLTEEQKNLSRSLEYDRYDEAKDADLKRVTQLLEQFN
jgi:hypothetical protein